MTPRRVRSPNGTFLKVEIVPRNCEQCGNQIPIRPSVKASVYATRRFCSNRCSNLGVPRISHRGKDKQQRQPKITAHPLRTEAQQEQAKKWGQWAQRKRPESRIPDAELDREVAEFLARREVIKLPSAAAYGSWEPPPMYAIGFGKRRGGAA